VSVSFSLSSLLLEDLLFELDLLLSLVFLSSGCKAFTVGCIAFLLIASPA